MPSRMAREFAALLTDGLAPLEHEMRRLRRLAMWRDPAKPPKHENAVLVSFKGDVFFACYRQPEGDGAGYWDRDIEYGGDAFSPDGWFNVPAFDPTNRHLWPKGEMGDAAAKRDAWADR